jgi:glyoxylase-like metal-dependent hydrolase (beta-lactamase superfamily II)
MSGSSSVAIPGWARLVIAPNPGPMTLEGTNSWVLGAPGNGDRVVVIDPGPLDEPHLLDLALHGEVDQILLTHGHRDHSEGAQRLHAITGAPVRAWDPRWLQHGESLDEGERIALGELTIEVIHTPGHTDDSVSFVVGHVDGGAALVTGDTILGRGTSVIAHPEGRLADYLATLERLSGLGGVVVLPGHGPVTGSAVDQATYYLTHRVQRLDEVRAAVRSGAESAQDVVDAVYADVSPEVREAALLSVQAQLLYLQRPDIGA